MSESPDLATVTGVQQQTWAKGDFSVVANLVYMDAENLAAALDLIPGLNEKFDLVFIDADKENYSRYFDLVIDNVNLNGIILADNVLWSGKVLDEEPDKDTRAIISFNRKVTEDDRVQNVLLPVRDGIMMMRKVK